MSLRVLVVEDHPIIQKVTEEMLGLQGHQSKIAVNGEEGVSFFDPTLYDLVLMDIGLPDISGHMAAKRMRDKERAMFPNATKLTTIVALTAHANQDSKPDVQGAEIDDWFEKPLTLAGLKGLLERLKLVPETTH